VGRSEQVPFTRPASTAISKIRSALPGPIRCELEKLDHHVAIRLAAASPPEAARDVHETIRAALARKVTLRCRYDSLTNDAKKKRDDLFLFKPYALFFNQRAWYVVGHHGGRRQVRCLKLNRFTKLELTAQAFAIPAKFSLEKHLGNAWRMIRGSRTHEVELWFDPQVADTVSDTLWHRTQEIEWNDDESIVFRCKVDGLEEIVWWVLGYGPHCVVRKPAELAGQVKALAAAMMQNYASNG
jgi:proteasome accessory factor B